MSSLDNLLNCDIKTFTDFCWLVVSLSFFIGLVALDTFLWFGMRLSFQLLRSILFYILNISPFFQTHCYLLLLCCFLSNFPRTNSTVFFMYYTWVAYMNEVLKSWLSFYFNKVVNFWFSLLFNIVLNSYT